MKITFSGKNIHLSDNFKEIVANKFDNPKVESAGVQEIDLHVTKDHSHELTLQVTIPHKKSFVIHEENKNLHEAVDNLFHKTVRQFDKIKDSHH